MPNPAPITCDYGPRSAAARDVAPISGARTRAVLSDVLIDQIKEGLRRDDDDGVRRSCALLDAIWADSSKASKAEASRLAVRRPAEMEPIVRRALLGGDERSAASIRRLPNAVLDGLATYPDGVVRRICERSDFEDRILPHALSGRESLRSAIARLYPAPLPTQIRDALRRTVQQGDSALGDILAARTDGFSDDIAHDLARLPQRARLARLRYAVSIAEPTERFAASPLLDKIAAKVERLTVEGERGAALDVLSHLMRLDVPAIEALRTDPDPIRLALALRGVCLPSSLATPLREREDWTLHPGRPLVDGVMGYPVARRFVAQMRAAEAHDE